MSAEQGNVFAQNNLGLLNANGQGVIQNYQEAVRWYRLAAEQGYALAQNNLSIMYWRGKGVTQDYEAAAKWFRLASKQGNADAQYNLGVLYRLGQGVVQDHQEAARLYRLAATQGKENRTKQPWSYYMRMVRVLFRTTKKLRNGIDWLQSRDMHLHKITLVCYIDVVKVWSKNYQEAEKLYRLAAEQGNAQWSV